MNNDDPNDASKAGQGELGSIYMDRHMMIGGFKGDLTSNTPSFQTYSSAIDISGGIANKPIMRVLTGSNKGSLVSQGSNCQDSIIIGNTVKDNISGDNIESLIFGDHEEIQDVNNTIVHGTNNKVYKLTNSLVVGNSLEVGNDGGTVIDGAVALGKDVTLSADERFVVGVDPGHDSNKKVFIIDKNGKVKINGNLEVSGEKVIVDVEHK